MFQNGFRMTSTTEALSAGSVHDCENGQEHKISASRRKRKSLPSSPNTCQPSGMMSISVTRKLTILTMNSDSRTLCASFQSQISCVDLYRLSNTVYLTSHVFVVFPEEVKTEIEEFLYDVPDVEETFVVTDKIGSGEKSLLLFLLIQWH